MRIPTNKLSDIIRYFKEQLAHLYSPSEIEVLLDYCTEEFLQKRLFSLKSDPSFSVNESELLRFSFAVKDLLNYKPIQYIVGWASFYNLKLRVNSNVLIPRPETEELVKLIISENQHKKHLKILDIGTGSGCIAIALKKSLPLADVTAVDVSAEALVEAGLNASDNNVEIKFLEVDILSNTEKVFPDSFDVIVSNPPYVAQNESAEMERNVLSFEPHLALFVADNDPLVFYKAIADFSLQKGVKGGELYFELNEKYALQTSLLLEDRGFKNIRILKDINDKNRILRGNIP